MQNLHELGKKHNTDKVDKWHTVFDKSYLTIYENYFSHFKNKKIKLLEIGVRDGASIKVWEDYFEFGEIYGIDIDPRCSVHNSKKIKIEIGCQADENLINKIMENVGYFDIIIDDGSHVNELTIKSFNLLFPHLSKDGIYIIEDTQCSYLEDSLYDGIIRGAWPGMNYNKNLSFVNRREDINSFFLKLIKDMDLRLENNDTSDGLEWIHFYPQLIVMKKFKQSNVNNEDNL